MRVSFADGELLVPSLEACETTLRGCISSLTTFLNAQRCAYPPFFFVLDASLSTLLSKAEGMAEISLPLPKAVAKLNQSLADYVASALRDTVSVLALPDRKEGHSSELWWWEGLNEKVAFMTQESGLIFSQPFILHPRSSSKAQGKAKDGQEIVNGTRLFMELSDAQNKSLRLSAMSSMIRYRSMEKREWVVESSTLTPPQITHPVNLFKDCMSIMRLVALINANDLVNATMESASTSPNAWKGLSSRIVDDIASLGENVF